MRQPDSPSSARRGLTARRSRILQVLDDSMQRKGYLPSMREIGNAVGLASTSSVSCQLSVLQKQGLITREPRRPRTVKVRSVEGRPECQDDSPRNGELLNYIPLVGRIAVGIPITAAEMPMEIVPLPRMLTGEGDLIMLRVSGDSMTGAAIADGDWVVARCQPDAENGDIVAAQLDSDTADGSEATVKTLSRRDGHVWLLPQNPAYPPILGDNATIIGKVVTVLRRV